MHSNETRTCEGTLEQGLNVAIVDYSAGNLFSVTHACLNAGLAAQVTSDPAEIRRAGAVILPGVGAFGDAMRVLRSSGIADALTDFVATGRPLIGICLGMQLLMHESQEFGRHQGLGLIDGDVVRLPETGKGGRVLRVPHVGWNRIYPAAPSTGEIASAAIWSNSPLSQVIPGQHVYFVHSYYVRPHSRSVVLAETIVGDTVFCSALHHRNVWAFQFHPEKSGPAGIGIYSQLQALIQPRETQRNQRHAA